MGTNPHTFGGRIRRDLDLPDLSEFEVPVKRVSTEQNRGRGGDQASSTKQVGKYLQAVIERNPTSFRIFSPDELESNKLVLQTTQRDYQWPTQPHDSHTGPRGGRVLEVLSEHTCQAWLQGYLLTGRHGLFPSYEAFLAIITSMMNQHAKFLKFSREFPWRSPVASLNYLETSTLWRQEHNGFSHQSPGFINSVLNQKAETARVYLPPDANCLLTTIDYCMQSTGKVNLVIANKNSMPQWLDLSEVIAHCWAGVSVWRWASTDDGVNPDVVLVGIGDSPTIEVMAAAHILRSELPELRVRVVNVTDLLVLEEVSDHPHGLDAEMFNALFTPDHPVIINFHGYPGAVKELLFGRPNIQRFKINGYCEKGTTTTPFDMHVRNGTSRFHLIMQAIRLAAAYNPRIATLASEQVHHYEYVLVDYHQYIETHGKDPDDISHWQWS